MIIIRNGNCPWGEDCEGPGCKRCKYVPSALERWLISVAEELQNLLDK